MQRRRRSKRNEEHGKGKSTMCRGGGVREMRSMGRGRAGCTEEDASMEKEQAISVKWQDNVQASSVWEETKHASSMRWEESKHCLKQNC